MRGEINYMMETDGGAESERLWREAHVRCAKFASESKSGATTQTRKLGKGIEGRVDQCDDSTTPGTLNSLFPLRLLLLSNFIDNWKGQRFLGRALHWILGEKLRSSDRHEKLTDLSSHPDLYHFTFRLAN